MREIVRILDWATFPLNVAAEIAARRLDPGTPQSMVSPESCVLYEKTVGELTALFEWVGLTASADPSTEFTLSNVEGLGMTARADPSTSLGMTDDATDSGER